MDIQIHAKSLSEELAHRRDAITKAEQRTRARSRGWCWRNSRRRRYEIRKMIGENSQFSRFDIRWLSLGALGFVGCLPPICTSVRAEQIGRASCRERV